MKCNENCRFFYRLQNKENIRKYGSSYCTFWNEFHNEGKPCLDFVPNDEEDEDGDIVFERDSTGKVTLNLNNQQF